MLVLKGVDGLERSGGARGWFQERTQRSRRHLEGGAIPCDGRSLLVASGLCLRAPLARGLLAPQGELEHRLQVKPRAAEADERDQTLGAVEAVRSAREGSNLPVHPLGAPVVEPQGDVRED